MSPGHGRCSHPSLFLDMDDDSLTLFASILASATNGNKNGLLHRGRSMPRPRPRRCLGLRTESADCSGKHVPPQRGDVRDLFPVHLRYEAFPPETARQMRDSAMEAARRLRGLAAGYADRAAERAARAVATERAEAEAKAIRIARAATTASTCNLAVTIRSKSVPGSALTLEKIVHGDSSNLSGTISTRSLAWSRQPRSST